MRSGTHVYTKQTLNTDTPQVTQKFPWERLLVDRSNSQKHSFAWRALNQMFKSLPMLTTLLPCFITHHLTVLALYPFLPLSPTSSPSPLFLPSPSWHSALSLIVDNWVGVAVGRPCLCVQRASGQVNGALVSSWEHSVSLFLCSITHLASQS